MVVYGAAPAPTTPVLWDTLPASIDRHLNQLWHGTCCLDLSSSADRAQ